MSGPGVGALLLLAIWVMRIWQLTKMTVGAATRLAEKGVEAKAWVMM